MVLGPDLLVADRAVAPRVPLLLILPLPEAVEGRTNLLSKLLSKNGSGSRSRSYFSHVSESLSREEHSRVAYHFADIASDIS